MVRAFPSDPVVPTRRRARTRDGGATTRLGAEVEQGKRHNVADRDRHGGRTRRPRTAEGVLIAPGVFDARDGECRVTVNDPEEPISPAGGGDRHHSQ